MTKKDKQALADYVRLVMDELHLKDWDSDVYVDRPSLEETSPDVLGENIRNAQVEVGRYRKTAEYTFDPDLLENASLEEIRHTVVHEAIHCHLGALWHWCRIESMDHLDITQQAYDLFTSGIECHLEYAVDGLADAIAPKLPLPDLPSRKKGGKRAS